HPASTSTRSRLRSGMGSRARTSRKWRGRAPLRPPPASRVRCGVEGHRPALLRLTPAGRRPLAQLTDDLRRYRELAQRRPAGEVLYAFLRDNGWLADLARATTVAAEAPLSQHR